MLVSVMTDDTFAVKKEAIWAISNAISGGTREQVRHIAGMGAIGALTIALEFPDHRLVKVALDGLNGAVAASDEVKAELVAHDGAVELILDLREHDDPGVCETATVLGDLLQA